MIPLKSLPAPARRPWWTWALALGCVCAFALQGAAWWGWHLDIASRLGVVPRQWLAWELWANAGREMGAEGAIWNLSPRLFSPFYALFLHGDIWHLGFNLLFLLVFGAALETELGRVRFVLCYFLGGGAAMVGHLAFHLGSSVPVIGASGAIAALLGAYLVRLPRAWVLTYFPPFFLFPVPAPLFLLVWAGGQVAGAWNAGGWLSAPSGTEIAWMAHLGGFAFGAWYGWTTRKGRKKAQGPNGALSRKTSAKSAPHAGAP